MAGFVEDDALIGCKQTVGPYVALLSEGTGLEIFILKRDCIAVSDSLTGYLKSSRSSPSNTATTKAGRLLAWVKSENGKGTTTTSPFTNLPKPRLLQVSANLF
jgi:hypothetical protein